MKYFNLADAFIKRRFKARTQEAEKDSDYFQR